MLGKTEGRKEKETTEDEMVGWHHWIDGHEFEEALGVGDEQGNLSEELDTTVTELIWGILSM